MTIGCVSTPASRNAKRREEYAGALVKLAQAHELLVDVGCVAGQFVDDAWLAKRLDRANDSLERIVGALTLCGPGDDEVIP